MAWEKSTGEVRCGASQMEKNFWILEIGRKELAFWQA